MDDKKKQFLLFSLTAILTVVPFILTLVGIIQCDFIKVTDDSQIVSIEFGVWNYSIEWFSEGDKSCKSYPPTMDIDASWKAARAFSILSLITGGILVLFSLIMLCAVLSGEYGVAGHMGHVISSFNTYWLDVIGYFMTATFTGFILLFLNGNVCRDNPIVEGDVNSCKLASGGNMVICAMMMWFVATIFSVQLDIERGNTNTRDSLSATYPTRPRPSVGSKV